ncbi:meiotic nuclear division 1 protein, partial [Tubulinosema ratisbonensis]
MLELFYETKEFFTLKELESIAPKRKGIVYKTVKEVLESLVNDDLVRTEKLGISNYYWSFPSQKLVAKQKLLTTLEKENFSLNENIKNLTEKIKKEELLRSSEERNELIKEYLELKNEEKKIVDELKMFEKCDPIVYKEKNDKMNEEKFDKNEIKKDFFDTEEEKEIEFNKSNLEEEKEKYISEDMSEDHNKQTFITRSTDEFLE